MASDISLNVNRSKTVDQFIAQAKAVHGRSYDYSDLSWVNAKSHVDIVCPTHGPFRQLPASHVKGYGCGKCSKERRAPSIDRFLSKARAVHGDRYDYSRVEFVDNAVHVTLVCREHGPFRQTPASHIRPVGCPSCAVADRTKPLEQFLTQARKSHGSRYDYSKVVYTGSNNHVLIVCPEHGTFSQNANSHVRLGIGCPACSAVKAFKPLEEFIADARAVHGDKYDYSKVTYMNNDTRVTIVCRKHGPFKQRPRSHTSEGKGCYWCGRDDTRITTEEFITRSKAIHRVDYDYSLVEYTHILEPVKIGCPTHGVFETIAHRHLSGFGCQGCIRSQVSKPEIQWLDSLRISEENRQVKLYLGNGRRVRVDGFDPVTSTVYEFYGDYWHGHPTHRPREDLNKSTGCSFGELYDRTMQREGRIKDAGYNLVTIWESDFEAT